MPTEAPALVRRSEASRRSCFVPRGETRKLALALKQAVLQRQLDAAAISAAVMLATQVHRHQRRSADGAPFLTHPLQVATLVCRWGGSSDDVITAVLHDAAEDSSGGAQPMLDYIAYLFSPAVSQCVAALTKNAALPDRHARTQDLMDRLQQAAQTGGPGVAAVRLADRLHNLVTAGHLPPEELARLHANTQAFITPLARSLGLQRLADFMAGGPPCWAQATGRTFVATMMQIQGPWLEAARWQRFAQAQASAICSACSV